LEGPPRQPVVRLRASFPRRRLARAGRPYIRYDGLLPIDGLGFTDQTGDAVIRVSFKLKSFALIIKWLVSLAVEFCERL